MCIAHELGHLLRERSRIRKVDLTDYDERRSTRPIFPRELSGLVHSAPPVEAVSIAPAGTGSRLQRTPSSEMSSSLPSGARSSTSRETSASSGSALDGMRDCR